MSVEVKDYLSTHLAGALKSYLAITVCVHCAHTKRGGGGKKYRIAVCTVVVIFRHTLISSQLFHCWPDVQSFTDLLYWK